MNEIVYRDLGVYMRIEVEGVERLRPAYLQCEGPHNEGRWKPELEDGEMLLETMGGDMRIVRTSTG